MPTGTTKTVTFIETSFPAHTGGGGFSWWGVLTLALIVLYLLVLIVAGWLLVRFVRRFLNRNAKPF